MAEWLPENQRDSAYYLDVPKFTVHVARRDIRTPEEIRLFGTELSGDRFVDQQMRNEIVVRNYTIFEIARLFAKGVQIGIVNKKDTVIIYDYIEQHLKYWITVIESGLAPRMPPMEELLILDRLASTVYDHARFIIPADFKIPGFVASLTGVNGGGGLSRNPTETPVTDPNATFEELLDQKYPPRKSKSTNIKAEGFKRGGRRW